MLKLWNKKGFTIIELLIVITVIAILIGIALPRFRGIQEEGNIARAKGELRTLQTGVESYLMHQGKLPTALADLVKSDTKPNLVGSDTPKDPFTSGSEYLYSVSGNYYIIYSVGPSGAGAPSVNDAGEVTADADAIYSSNGKPKTVAVP